MIAISEKIEIAKVKYRPGPSTCSRPKEEEREYTDGFAEVAESTKGRGVSE